MAYDISWLIENRIIHIIINGDVNSDALNAMTDDVMRLLDENHTPQVHLLINDKQIKVVPKQILKMLNSSRSLRHPRLGWLIIYGTDNKLFRFLTQMLSRMINLKQRRFLTQEEAITFLQTVDATLPELNISQS
jgi:hypothetical protein